MDLIDRQEAIRGIVQTAAKKELDVEAIADVINVLEHTPSAEPVRCKDCKHRDPEDKKCDCGHDILWQLPRQNDWYCADAERRTDE